MHRIASAFGLAAALSATSVSDASSTASPSRHDAGLIVALGDSLTSGHGIRREDAYPAVLQTYLERERLPYRVVNAGVSGNTSGDAVARLDRALHGDVRILIVALGANDGLRGVPVPRVKAQLTSIIEEAQRRRIAVLLCALEALPIYGWEYTVDFHRMYRELASKYDVPLVPFILAEVIGRRELMLPDHVHPNEAGARVIADAIWPYLRDVARSAANGRA